MGNPYRQILRRRVPEPILALLAFVMGVYLWDIHFGPVAGYEQGTCQMALLKNDRDLRLADATAGLPPLLRSALAIPDRREALETAVGGLEQLGRAGALDPEGAYALAILSQLGRGENPARGPFVQFGLPGPPDPRTVLQRIQEKDDSWWDREYLRNIEIGSESELELYAGTAEADPRNRELAMRAILSRGAVWLLVLAGLAFLPTVFRSFGRGLKSRAGGYVGNLPLGLGLCVFLLAYLASNGFGEVLNQLISGAWAGENARPVMLSPVVFAMVDLTARILPALVALGFLFRSGRHALGRLGLNARPELGLVLGTFALITLIDQLLRRTIGESVVQDPTGGLSSMDSGPLGLMLAFTSACIAAPVAEEILYRGVLFRSLANRLRVPAATLLSAAVFAVVHFYNAYGLISVGILGAACALCFASSGRLVTAIVLHSLYNTAIKVPEWIVYHAAL